MGARADSSAYEYVMPRPEPVTLPGSLPEGWEIVYYPGRQQPYTLTLRAKYKDDRHIRFYTRSFHKSYKEAVARAWDPKW